MTKITRYLAAICAAAAFALPASAATGPWQWEDISSKIPVNRSSMAITAVGQFKGDWYYTNGKDFAKGGKVWKLWADGHVTEVTGSLKKAGLTRVDRIESVPEKISYWQSMGANKQMKAVEWDGANLLSVSTWDIDVALNGMNSVHLLGLHDLSSLAAGGASADGVTDVLHYIYMPEGGYSTAQTVDLSAQLANVPVTKWQGGIASSNGKSWMILVGWNLMRFDGENLTYLGTTRDKFTSVTSMDDGTFLLGGMTSDKVPMAKLVKVFEAGPVVATPPAAPAPEQPAFPEQPVAPAPTPTQPAGPAVTTFLNSMKPDTFVNGVRTFSTATDGSYGVTATNSGGVKTLELLVNGTVKQTCDGAGATQVYCRLTLKAKDFSDATTLNLSARATDMTSGTVEDAAQTIGISR